MEYIDLKNWKRKEHFELFYGMDYPQFSICGNIDISNFLVKVKEQKISFYYAMIYAATQMANQATNFRYRIRENKVVLHDIVHPSFTYLKAGEDELFKIITVEVQEDLLAFIKDAGETAQHQEGLFSTTKTDVRDDVLHITAVPWISFTNLSHTISLNKNDSVPRIAWGKYFTENNKVLLPLSVQVNHALVDGVHVGSYFAKLQEYLNEFH